MARTALQYRKQLQSLLPKGKLWNRDEDSILTKLLYGMSDELVRIEERAENLIEEQDVRSTTELITEHEEDFGIPEVGEELGSTLEIRRGVLEAALLKIGEQNEEYFKEIAEALGYIIIIQEYQPFWCGYSTCGMACGTQENLFYWTVYIDLDYVTESYEVNIERLIFKINRVKPRHTLALYDFYGAAFSRAFGRGFDRIPYYDNSWLELDFNRNFDNSFANAYDYDGVNYTGSYNKGFSISFDRRNGGAFNYDNFSGLEYDRPA